MKSLKYSLIDKTRGYIFMWMREFKTNRPKDENNLKFLFIELNQDNKDWYFSETPKKF